MCGQIFVYFSTLNIFCVWQQLLKFLIDLNYRSQRDRSGKNSFAELEAASEPSRRSAEKKAKKAERDAGYKLIDAMDNAAAKESLNAFLNDDDDGVDKSPDSMMDEDEDWLPEDLEFLDEEHKAQRNYCDLQLTAMMSMKYNFSNSGVAAVIAGFLIDNGYVSSADAAAKIVDRNKIYRYFYFCTGGPKINGKNEINMANKMQQSKNRVIFLDHLLLNYVFVCRKFLLVPVLV